MARLPAHHLALGVGPDGGISLVLRARVPGPGTVLDAVPVAAALRSDRTTHGP